MTFNPLLCFFPLLNVLNSPPLPALCTKPIHLPLLEGPLELEAPGSSHEPILRGGKSFSYNHNLERRRKGLILPRAAGAERGVPSHPGSLTTGDIRAEW